VGDALGAPVEFLGLADIRRRFGYSGIEEFAPVSGRKCALTDDTQITLWTAEGLIRADNRGREKARVPEVV
jgi:ADP-ribosylglycohydrolase